MKKRLGSLLLATVLLLSLFTFVNPAESVSAAATVKAKVNASSLNVRAKASTSAKKLGALKKGNTVTISQEKSGWSKIPYGKTSGWVSSKYLTKVKTVKAASASVTKNGYVTATTLNLRSSASTSSKTLATLKKGLLVNIKSTSGTWYKVYVPSTKKTGWVSKSYISTKKPVTAVKTEAKGTIYYVTASELNIRKSASPTAKVVTSVKKNAKVTVSKISGKWASLKTASGKSGWASTSYLTKKEPVKKEPVEEAKPAEDSTPDVDSEVYYVTSNGLNIRKAANTTAKVLTTVKKNEEVTLLEVNDDNWGKVLTTAGVIGWASMKYLTDEEPVRGVNGKVIVLDPGHGGSDPGAAGKNNFEKTLTLKTAKKLQSKLENAGATVIMTRTGDTKPSLTDRVEISEKHKADVFISIHYNASTNKDANGVDTFYYKTHVNEYQLAKCIQEEVIKATGMKSRGVKEGNFQVIRTNKQASILVELGFISNPTEEKIIATDAYQTKAATGIFNGLEKYFNL
ncbi:N-acetylmuramoyl-L-alanine amidase [Peribacillus sp. FSL H8-0477]|uniref:N-acetylmuramoyl-L-alanine amidase n=1 Tax=Peribacillus sp. FSL H8-0477 TaxID=2921388 RepID=UPI0030F835A4